MLNLDAYFVRTGYEGPRAPTFDVLQAVCARHASAFPFENIDPLLGCTPDLAPAALQGKMIEQERGGYCFEQNTVLREVLQGLGMQVIGLAARVVWMAPPEMPPRARTHMLLKVETADRQGRAFIVDVGFGGQLFNVPLLLAPDVEQSTPNGLMRIAHDEGSYAVETLLPQGWAPLYRFDLQALLPVDYEPLNWFTATHPTSIFRHNLLVQSLTSDGRISLLNDRFVRVLNGGEAQVKRIDNVEDFDAALRQVFKIALPVPAHELFDRIPKGQDGFVVPPSRAD